MDKAVTDFCFWIQRLGFSQLGKEGRVDFPSSEGGVSPDVRRGVTCFLTDMIVSEDERSGGSMIPRDVTQNAVSIWDTCSLPESIAKARPSIEAVLKHFWKPTKAVASSIDGEVIIGPHRVSALTVKVVGPMSYIFVSSTHHKAKLGTTIGDGDDSFEDKLSIIKIDASSVFGSEEAKVENLGDRIRMKTFLSGTKPSLLSTRTLCVHSLDEGELYVRCETPFIPDELSPICSCTTCVGTVMVAHAASLTRQLLSVAALEVRFYLVSAASIEKQCVDQTQFAVDNMKFKLRDLFVPTLAKTGLVVCAEDKVKKAIECPFWSMIKETSSVPSLDYVQRLIDPSMRLQRVYISFPHQVVPRPDPAGKPSRTGGVRGPVFIGTVHV